MINLSDNSEVEELPEITHHANSAQNPHTGYRYLVHYMYTDAAPHCVTPLTMTQKKSVYKHASKTC